MPTSDLAPLRHQMCGPLCQSERGHLRDARCKYDPVAEDNARVARSSAASA